MLSKILQLALGPHYLTQAEEEKLLIPDEQIHKIHSKWSSVKKVAILSKNRLIWWIAQLVTMMSFSQLEINHSIQEPTAES
jgi:hypothetical protein